MELNEDNYFSLEANKEYWSVSQFKSFNECSARAVAELDGEYVRPKSEALLLGGYVDAYFTGSIDLYEQENPEILNSRTGALKAPYQKAKKAVERAESDPMFMMYMAGEKQKILTGKLFGEDWKVKIDVLHKDRIVDLKYMRDTKSMFVDGERKTFVDAWGYDLQGFVYQQIVEAATGKHLPFYLAVVTKEEHPDIDIIHIPDWKLNSAGELIRHYLPEYADIKANTTGVRCEHCDWCRDTKIITEITEYEELLERI